MFHGTTTLYARLALAAAGILTLTGCAAPGGPAAPSGGSGGTDQRAAAQPKRGGYLRHLLPYSAQNIDPYTTEDPTGYQFIASDWYEGLTSIDYQPGQDWRVENKVVPLLAESWKMEDKNTYLFTLRKGVKFHNGDPFSADDVVFSLSRFLDGKEKINPTVARYVGSMASVEKVDDYTVRIKTRQPDPEFLAGLAQRLISILDKKWVEGGGDLTKQAIGTGPFTLAAYRKDAEGLALRNEEYWQPGRPYLDGIKMSLKVDDATTAAAAAAGQADIIMRNDRQQFLPIQAANPGIQFTKVTNNSLNGITVNVKKPILSDVRVRKAIHLALDRDEMYKAMTFGEGVQTGPLVQAGKTGWSIPQEELLKLPGYRQPKDQDIAEARRLLAEAGYAEGFKTTIMFSPAVEVSGPTAEAVQAQLKKSLNIQGELQPVDAPTRVQRLTRGDFELAIDSAGYLDKPSLVAQSNFHSRGAFAMGAGIDDPELDRLIDAQGEEFDNAKRGALFVQIQRLLLDRLYTIPVPQSVLYQIWQPWVHDWVGNMGSRPTIMNPTAIWMDLDAAPADRKQR